MKNRETQLRFFRGTGFDAGGIADISLGSASDPRTAYPDESDPSGIEVPSVGLLVSSTPG
jgi:hypothetical protein